MPINVPDNLPAVNILERENIFTISNTRALHQDIRPLRMAFLNIMPVKQTTETHILRLLSNTPLQLEIDLIYPESHTSKHTHAEHLRSFYKPFGEIRDHKYDGMIITGAPVEHLKFEEVDYWKEMMEIIDWSLIHVTSTLYICWAAQAGLYHLFGIQKHPLEKKLSGIFLHRVNNRKIPLVRGFDDVFPAPHSRYTRIRRRDVEKHHELEIVSESERAGLYIIMNKNNRQIFITGHSEYDPETLKEEYFRDIKKGIEIEIPENYFPDDNPSKKPLVTWRSHANLLFTNWLNYYVYQLTPFDINLIH